MKFLSHPAVNIGLGSLLTVSILWTMESRSLDKTEVHPPTQQIINYQDSFTYLNSEQDSLLPSLTEDELSVIIHQYTKSPVFLKNIKGSSLSLVVVDGQLAYMESTGRFLIKGDVYDISNGLIISNVIQQEFETKKQMSDVVSASKIGNAASFLSSKLEPTNTAPVSVNQVNLSKEAKPTQSEDETAKVVPSDQVSNGSEKRFDFKPKPSSVPYKSTELIQSSDSSVAGGALDVFNFPIRSMNDEPVPPALLARASKLSASTPRFADQCIDMLLQANSFSALYAIINALPADNNNEAAKKCGGAYGGKLFPVLPDDSLVVYKAPEERGSITVASDFTCGFCKKLHNEIPQYLEKGITVKVLPYGRESYRDSTGNATTIALNNEIVMCQTPERKKEAMDLLTSNPRKYSQELLEGFEPVTQQCRMQTHRYKVLGNAITRGETPFVVNHQGIPAMGYFPIGTYLQRAGML